MAVVEQPVKSNAAASSVKTAALAAVAHSVQASVAKQVTGTPSKLKKVEDGVAAEPVVKKAPQVDIEEVRHWMRQTIVYVALAACIVAMVSAHYAGKSFLATTMCGATAAILSGIAGTVVAQIGLSQVAQPDESASASSTNVQ